MVRSHCASLCCCLHAQVVKTLNGHMASYCSVVLETCAYAGTGDVLKIQQMLAAAGEHIETDEPNSWKVTASQLCCACSQCDGAHKQSGTLLAYIKCCQCRSSLRQALQIQL